MARVKTAKKKFNRKLIPLILMMFVPLIMYYQNLSYDTKLTYPYYVDVENYADLFSFYKSIAIYVIAVLCILFYILYTKKDNMVLRKDRLKYYIPVAVYSLFIILSTIFSVFPRIAITGIYERYEGAMALISYFIFMVYAIEVLKNDIDMNIIFTVFLGMVSVVSIIGLLQFYVVDIFSIPFFQKIVGIPEGAILKANFENWAYSTLYNPNNLGQFASLTAPVAAGILLAFKTKKGKIFAGITLILSLWAGYASSSANFIAGIAAAGLFFFVLFASHLIPRKKTAKIVLFAIIGILIVGMLAVSGKIWNRIKNSGFVRDEIESIFPEKDDVYFEDIKVSDDTIAFITTQGAFYLRYTDLGISFYDTDLNYVEFDQNGTHIRFKEEPFKTQWAVNIKSKNSLELIAKRAFSFTRVEVIFDETKFLGIKGTGQRILHEVMENQMPERFRGLETIASRRGYLWIVTMSRLDEVFFIGSGPDTFLYWFEQNDVIGKVNFLHSTSILADKPHNWYLQIASQTGVISLIAFLSMMGIYFVSTIKLLGLRRKKNYYEFIAAGISCGLLGYMTSSLFVDSTVSVTPLFYIFLGFGIVSNEFMKRNGFAKKKEKNTKKNQHRK